MTGIPPAPAPHPTAARLETLIVILDRGAVAFCNYANPHFGAAKADWMPLDVLRQARGYAAERGLRLIYLWGKLHRAGGLCAGDRQGAAREHRAGGPPASPRRGRARAGSVRCGRLRPPLRAAHRKRHSPPGPQGPAAAGRHLLPAGPQGQATEREPLRRGTIPAGRSRRLPQHTRRHGRPSGPLRLARRGPGMQPADRPVDAQRHQPLRRGDSPPDGRAQRPLLPVPGLLLSRRGRSRRQPFRRPGHSQHPPLDRRVRPHLPALRRLPMPALHSAEQAIDGRNQHALARAVRRRAHRARGLPAAAREAARRRAAEGTGPGGRDSPSGAS